MEKDKAFEYSISENALLDVHPRLCGDNKVRLKTSGQLGPRSADLTPIQPIRTDKITSCTQPYYNRALLYKKGFSIRRDVDSEFN